MYQVVIIEIIRIGHLLKNMILMKSQIQGFPFKSLISGTFPRFASLLSLSLTQSLQAQWANVLFNTYSSSLLDCRLNKWILLNDIYFYDFLFDFIRTVAQERIRVSFHRLDIPHSKEHRLNFLLFDLRNTTFLI